VADIYGRVRVHDRYFIESTPQLYILDREKKIIAKRLNAEQAENFLRRLLQLPALPGSNTTTNHQEEDH
jgi:hypothetical protein